MSALEMAGFKVSLASEFRSWEGTGDRTLQQSIHRDALAIAEELIQRYRQLPGSLRPQAWFTYHVYHKAPDWIGPRVCETLQIPYFLAEASIGQKQSGGPWDPGYQSSLTSIQLAQKIFTINPTDAEGLRTVVTDDRKLISMTPFLDLEALNPSDRNQLRNEIAAKLKIDPDKYWLLSVAMMRNDSKLRSYEVLARAMELLQRKDWVLLLVGDGAAELLVRDYFRFDLDRRVNFLGKRGEAFVREIMGASDLLVWPAINEAIGMVALESLSCGLPVVWGRSGAIGQIVEDGLSGKLIDRPESPDSAARFSDCIESLLSQPQTMASMSSESLKKYQKSHQLQTAARILRDSLGSKAEGAVQ